MECSLLYVSRATIAADRVDAEVDVIIATSRDHNARVDITGGLVRAAGYFSQLLEGSTEAVESLMERISRDPRHTDVNVLRVMATDQRLLGDWSMAYAGESSYVANQIAPLLGAGLSADTRRIDRLQRLIVAFAST